MSKRSQYRLSPRHHREMHPLWLQPPSSTILRNNKRPPIPLKPKEQQKVPRASIYTKLLG
eukprot:4815450-Amphidinium_carterae.1